MRQRVRKGILNFSALLFPVLFMFLSPYVIIAAASEGFINGSAIIFTLLLLYSILGSRLFCGWLCPGGAIQDYAAATNNKPWNSKMKNASKYLIWVVWLAFIIYLWSSGGSLSVSFFYMIGFDVNMTIMYFIVTTLIYFLTLALGRRSMCHSYCWMAPFMVLGEKAADFLQIPRFRLKADSKTCISCGQCNKRCPMSLDVQGMVKSDNMNSTECITCLECVDNCPKKAIGCGFGRAQKK